MQDRLSEYFRLVKDVNITSTLCGTHFMGRKAGASGKLRQKKQSKLLKTKIFLKATQDVLPELETIDLDEKNIQVLEKLDIILDHLEFVTAKQLSEEMGTGNREKELRLRSGVLGKIHQTVHKKLGFSSNKERCFDELGPNIRIKSEKEGAFTLISDEREEFNQQSKIKERHAQVVSDIAVRGGKCRIGERELSQGKSLNEALMSLVKSIPLKSQLSLVDSLYENFPKELKDKVSASKLAQLSDLYGVSLELSEEEQRYAVIASQILLFCSPTTIVTIHMSLGFVMEIDCNNMVACINTEEDKKTGIIQPRIRIKKEGFAWTRPNTKDRVQTHRVKFDIDVDPIKGQSVQRLTICPLDNEKNCLSQ
jgi:hypothetical protein